MALTDSAVILPGVGHVLLAPVGTAAPADPASIDITADPPVVGYTNMGHTSRENNASIARDGGDLTTLGSWQNAALRESQAPVIWSLTVNALQIDDDVLSLYFGGGDTTTAGSFGVSQTSAPTQKALYLLLIDGANRVGLYLPKVSVTADEAPEFDPEAFLEFSLHMTVLSDSTNPDLMRWYAVGLGTAV